MMEEQKKTVAQKSSETEAVNVDFQDGEFVFASRRRPPDKKSPRRRRGLLLVIALLIGGFSVFYFRLYQQLPSVGNVLWNPEIRSLTFDLDAISTNQTIQIRGKVNLPDEALLVITLAKAEEMIDQKEVIVLDHRFAVTFGPQILVRYPFLGDINIFTPGPYHVSAVFNPLQQPEKIQQSIGAHGEKIQEILGGEVVRQPGSPAPLFQVVKHVEYGSPQEQQQAKESEEQQRQIIRIALGEAVKDLLSLSLELQTRYEYFLAEGGLRRNENQKREWMEWSHKWKERLEAIQEKHQFYEEVVSSAPFYPLREAIAQTYKQLEVLQSLYADVLLQERGTQSQKLRELQQSTQTTIEKVSAELAITVVPQRSKTMIQITADTANIRSGPTLAHEVVGRGKQGERFEMVAVERGWYQIRLAEGKLGWIHSSLISRQETAPLPESRASAPPILDLKPLPPNTPLANIPRPTKDELRIYEEIEQQFLTIPPQQFREGDKSRIVGEIARKYGISPQETWNTYLKVQGWQVKQ
jgi:hypothetical protein